MNTSLARLARGCATVDELRWEFMMGRVLSLYSPDVADHVELKKPKTSIDLANVMHDYLEGRQHWKDRRTGSHSSGTRLSDRQDDGHRRSDSRGEAGSSASGRGSEKSGNKSILPNVKSEPGIGSGSRDSGGSWQPTCYGCGKVGRHIAPARSVD